MSMQCTCVSLLVSLLIVHSHSTCDLRLLRNHLLVRYRDITMFSLYPLLALIALASAAPYDQIPLQIPAQSKNTTLVPVELAMMSRCPDFFICASVFDRVFEKASNKVDPKLLYIGDLDESISYGVRCMHGPSECRGNVQQLCCECLRGFYRVIELTAG